MLNILTGEQTKEKRCSDMFQTLVISQLGIFINTRGIHESMYRLQYIFVSWKKSLRNQSANLVRVRDTLEPNLN